MAISSEERKILNEFVKQNKNLLCSVINELEDVSDEAKNALTESIKDYSSYLFDGIEYNKTQLVLAVIKRYVSDKSPKDYSELKNAFPDNIQGSKGVIKKDVDISPKDKGIGGQKRYHINDPIILDSGEIVLVCTQWGVGNIERFINCAAALGYMISKN